MAKISDVLEEWADKLGKLEKRYDDMDHKGQKGWKELGTAVMLVAAPVKTNHGIRNNWGRGMFRDNVEPLCKSVPKQAADVKKKALAYAKNHDSPKFSLLRTQTWTDDGRTAEQSRADWAKDVAKAMDELAREFKSADCTEVPARPGRG